MKTILVTGAAGFIGSHTAKKLLEQGYKVIGVDNFNRYYDPNLKKARVKFLLPGATIYKYDIADYKNIKKVFLKYKIDTICHLAAQAGVRYSVENPFIYETSNLKGTLNLLELAREFKVKHFVFASSSSVYGQRSKAPFMEKESTDQPVSLYAATKKATELLVYSYHRLYGINATALRFFTVYGPWGRPDMALFKFTKNILEGKPIEVYNQGKMQRDFTYIDDIASGVVKAIQKPFAWEVVNLCASRPVNLTVFIGALEKAIGRNAKKKFMPLQKGDVLKTYGSSKKANRLLGFKAQTKLENGVKQFVNWYKRYYGVK